MAMSSRITLALVFAVALIATATASAADRNKNQMVKPAQYCVPDDDEPGGKSDLYCLMS